MRATFALKAAACAVVAVGIALFAVASITPAVDREHSIATASSPLRPQQRIEFSDVVFAYLEEPSCEVPTQYHPEDQCYGTLTARLFLPGISEDEYEISLFNASDIRVCTEDACTVDLDAPAEKTSVTVSKDNDYVFSFVWPTEMSPKKFQDLFSDEGLGLCVESETASFIDSIRDIRIVVKTSADTKVYRLDYGKLTDLMSLRCAFIHQEYRPIMVSLVEESEHL